MATSYETETCTRCSGSGHYSYNQMTGTRCFKCGGSGLQYTKRGKATQQFAESIMAVLGSEIKVGDVMRIGKKGQITAQSLEVTEKRSHAKPTGATEFPMRTVVTVTGPNFSRDFYGDWEYKRLLTAEQSQQVRDYQDNLTKAGKPRKTPA
ncbi:MAG: hypothetical protein ACJAZ1_002078 [Yoonia sp.]|jgi:hypothetical protein